MKVQEGLANALLTQAFHVAAVEAVEKAVLVRKPLGEIEEVPAV